MDLQVGIGLVDRGDVTSLSSKPLFEDPKKEPGNFGDPLSLGQYDIDMRRMAFTSR